MDILEETKADFVMIARGAQGNPHIFSQCIALDEGREWPELTTESLMDMLIQQAEIACLHKGEKKAVAELRKHTLWYLGNLPCSKTLKVRASMINSLDELKTVCRMAIQEGLQPRG